MRPDARSLILDLDGTLIDSRPGILESFSAAVTVVFAGRAFDLSSVVLGPPIKRMFQISFPEASEAEIDGLNRIFREHYDREGWLHTRLYEGLCDVLTHCQSQGLVLHIATNKPLHISTAILAHLGIEHYFRSILAADSVQPPFASKASMIENLLKSHQVNRGETIYVGDSSEDAAACAACGIRFVWAAYGYGKLTKNEAKEAFATIHRPGVLTALLKAKTV